MNDVTVKVRRTEQGFAWDLLNRTTGPDVAVLASNIGEAVGQPLAEEQVDYLNGLAIGEEGEIGFAGTEAQPESGDSEDVSLDPPPAGGAPVETAAHVG